MRSYTGLVFPSAGHGKAQFLLPLGVFHRIRTAPGQQWCPQCFATDERPYWRKAWRLAFNTTCLKHGILLADRCQDCGTPVSVQKSLDFTCYKCGAHFDEHPCQLAKSVVLQTQGQFDYVINGLAGDNYPFNFGVKHPTAFFRIVWHLLSMLSAGPRSGQLRKTIEQHRNLETMNDPKFVSGNRFEDLGVNSRYLLIERLAYLISGWPWMMIGYCQDSDFLWSWIVKDHKPTGTPFELALIADRFLSNHNVSIRRGMRVF